MPNVAMTEADIAFICHEANRAYCSTIGDHSQKPWHEAEEWQRASAVAGVHFALSGAKTPEEQHNSWMGQKITDGWRYGPEKDADAKTHPCMVPYQDLPIEQRRKDALFLAIVAALTKKDDPK